MRVQIIPSMEDCMTCGHCPEVDAPPSETCIKCQTNPSDQGEVVQFLMDSHTAYAVVLIEDEFYLADINNIRLIHPELEQEVNFYGKM